MMKKTIALTLAAMSFCALAADDAVEDAPNMGSPTEVYTYLGASYGTEGANLKGMMALSEDKGEYAQKSGILFEVKNIFNEGDKNDKFGGIEYGLYPDGSVGPVGTKTKGKASNRSYRLRYGTINTKNGLGFSVDAVFADHPFFGSTSVIQAGPVATIPVGDKILIWPILYVGGVIMDDNIQDLNPEWPDSSSSGVDIASTIGTAMVYVNWKFTDKWWMLASYRYTMELNGKSWDDDVADGGLQMDATEFEVSVAYQLTKKQNVRTYYSTAKNDSFWVEYNYAF
ncbi:hypothetical protein [Ferrimonas kyonanensis]|uniref:hypothetical protein n=1 Tax=Ferrimonas kyonanensis TaxID=364763 RepID=UPI000485BD88|nr:hypothetical protein [Ferrimonas kyonanensis]